MRKRRFYQTYQYDKVGEFSRLMKTMSFFYTLVITSQFEVGFVHRCSICTIGVHGRYFYCLIMLEVYGIIGISNIQVHINMKILILCGVLICLDIFTHDLHKLV